MTTSNYDYTQSQTRQSRRSLWLALGLIGVIALFGAALLTTGVVAGLNAFFHETSNPIPVAANYYLSIMRHDYTGAYASLDSNATINGEPVNQQSFAREAVAVDARAGSVIGYSIEEQGSDPSRLVVTVQRGSRAYQVHLLLKQEGGAWKVISADGI